MPGNEVTAIGLGMRLQLSRKPTTDLKTSIIASTDPRMFPSRKLAPASPTEMLRVHNERKIRSSMIAST